MTGDTLLHNKSFAEGLKDSAALPGVAVPDPVSLSKTNFNYSRKSKIFRFVLFCLIVFVKAFSCTNGPDAIFLNEPVGTMKLSRFKVV